MLPGKVNNGGISSATVTMKLPFAVFPRESVAEQLTVVCPRGNIEPETCEQAAITGPSTKSLAEVVKLTTAPEALVAETVILEGSVNTGGVVSTTVTLKLAVPTLPCVSVAVQLTVVVPNAKVEPEAGVHDCDTTVSSGSLAEAL